MWWQEAELVEQLWDMQGHPMGPKMMDRLWAGLVEHWREKL